MPDISELTFICRTNTVCIDIVEAHPEAKVPIRDWMMFLKEDLGLVANDLVEAQVHSITNLLMVKFKEEKKFEEIVKKLEKGVHWSQFNTMVYGWNVHQNLITVRLINLSVHVDKEKVLRYFETLGEVVFKSEGELKGFFKGVKDNSLTLKIKLNEGAEVKPYIKIGPMGEFIQVFLMQLRRSVSNAVNMGILLLSVETEPRRGILRHPSQVGQR